MRRPRTLEAHFEDALTKVSEARKVDREALRDHLKADRLRFERLYYTARGPKQRAVLDFIVTRWLDTTPSNPAQTAQPAPVPAQMVGNLFITPTLDDLQDEWARNQSKDRT